MRGKYLTSFGLLTAGVTVAAMAANVYGTAGNDSLHGTATADGMYGYAGNDTIVGGAGNDTIFGGDGDDRLYGGTGWNRLVGGAGNDTFETQTATHTSIDDYQQHELINIDCNSDWGGDHVTENSRHFLSQNNDVFATGDVAFTGRDGTQVVFKGLTRTAVIQGFAVNIRGIGIGCLS
jgi:RTX calcium-binding nonapeptide repeat (4 copies)